MVMKRMERVLLVLTALTVLLYLGGHLADRAQAEGMEPAPAETAAPETAEETCPETEPEPDLREDACREVGTQIRAGCAFAYDVAQRKMLYSSVPATQQLYPASLTKLFDNVQISNADLFAFICKEQGVVDGNVGFAGAVVSGKKRQSFMIHN